MIDFIWSADMDIIFLAIAYGVYRWGKKRGIDEGRRNAYKEERLYRLEERFDEMCDKAKSSDG